MDDRQETKESSEKRKKVDLDGTVQEFPKAHMTFKTFLAILMNSSIFAVAFGVAFYYFRTNPQKLHTTIDRIAVHFAQLFDYGIYLKDDVERFCRYLIYTILLTPLIYVFNNVFQPRFAHIRDSSTRNAVFPIWMCAIFGYLILAVVDSIIYGANYTGGTYARCHAWFCMTTAASVFVWLFGWATKSDPIEVSVISVSNKSGSAGIVQLNEYPKQTIASSSNIESGPTEAEILAWLESDDPTEHDLLGTRLAEKAKQLRDLIVNREPDKRIQSIGIVGRHGTGKSSMVNFLKKELSLPEHKNKFIFCQVSTWRFDESASAIQHILTEMLRGIGQHIDTFRVRKLPDTFRKGFSSLGGELLDKLSDMLFGDESLESRLKKLNEMLALTGKTIILVVEDLDRRDDTKFDSGQVQAFLHLMREMPKIIPIISGDPTKSDKHKIDFEKICSYKIEFHVPDWRRTQELIVFTKRLCENSAPVSLAKGLIRQSSSIWSDKYWLEDETRVPGLTASILAVLESPRAIKHSLRRTVHIWNNGLCGEVDWDQLFLAAVLRNANYSLLYYLERQYTDLCKNTHSFIYRYKDNPVRTDGNPKNAKTHPDRVDWDKFCGDHYDSRLQYEVIMSHLICGFATINDLPLERLPQYIASKPQGAHHFRYWSRMLNESTNIVARDSQWLSEFVDWRETGECEFLIKVIENPEYQDIGETLAANLDFEPSDKLNELLRDLVRVSCDKYQPKAIPPTKLIRRIAQLICKRHESSWYSGKGPLNENPLKDFYGDLVKMTSRKSLRLLYEVFSAFSPLMVIDNNFLNEKRQQIKSFISEDPDNTFSIVEFIGYEDSQILFELISVKHDRENEEQSATQWQWLGNLIYQYLKNDTETLKPAVFGLITCRAGFHIDNLDQNLGRAFFGGIYPQVMKLIGTRG